MFERTEILIGDKLNKLHNSNVIVFGVGGVGGYAVEMLVRSGIGAITLVDFDTVSVSNKNRQIIANDQTIGQSKVGAFADRIKLINKDCVVTTINDKLLESNIDNFELTKYDYIVDCIDMVSSKIVLIKYAHDNNIPIISSMGAGNRIGLPDIVVTDIYQTYNDGLAKVIRKKLKELGINNHTVVFSKNLPKKINSSEIGSISYFPASMGIMISAYIINEIIR